MSTPRRAAGQPAETVQLLSDRAHEVIRDKLVHFVIAPGNAIDEAQLASELGRRTMSTFLTTLTQTLDLSLRIWNIARERLPHLEHHVHGQTAILKGILDRDPAKARETRRASRPRVRGRGQGDVLGAHSARHSRNASYTAAWMLRLATASPIRNI